MVERRDYFRNRFTVEELRSVLSEAEIDVRTALSRRSRAYRSRSAEIDAVDDEGLLAAMVDEPTLLRRPIVVSDSRAVIGFNRDGLSALVAVEHES